MSTPPGSFPPPPPNPYGAPLARVDDAPVASGGIVERARSVGAGRGIGWYGEAWRLFKVAPGTWIGIWLIMVVCLIVLSLIPFLGALANALLVPIFLGGVTLAARNADRSGIVDVGTLFAAFGTHAGPLALIGLLQLVATFIIGIVLGLGAATMIGFSAIAGGLNAAGPPSLQTFATFFVIGALVGLLLVPVTLATWLAAALVTLNNVPAIDALRMGFGGVLRNVLPFFLFLVVGALLAMVATLPFLLGWLVVGPLFLCTVYVQYRELFAASA